MVWSEGTTRILAEGLCNPPFEHSSQGRKVKGYLQFNLMNPAASPPKRNSDFRNKVVSGTPRLSPFTLTSQMIIARSRSLATLAIESCPLACLKSFDL
jgi:hypothetical protein